MDRGIFKKSKKILYSNDADEYRNKLKIFTKNIYDNSKHIDIPNLQIPSLETEFEKNETTIKNITKNIIEELLNGEKSRFLLLSSNNNDKFYDIHSMIALDVIENGNDLLILEKEQIASNPHVNKLSKIITSYCYNYFYKNLTFNVCNKPVNKLYPEN